jgi:hypothetical protein
MKNKSLVILLFLIIGAVLTGCNKDRYSESKEYNNYSVNIDKAVILAVQAFSSTSLNYKSNSDELKIKNQKTFLDKNNSPYFHIFNFENDSTKAFIIISGDQRTEPILAYSKSNSFNFEGKMPYGVVEWLICEEDYIDHIRGNKIKQIEPVKNLWTKVALPENQLKFSNFKNEPTDPPCNGSYNLVVNPLLQTTWGQGCVYNAQCPTGCSSNCNHYPTGCVATAMAQVLKYHHYQNLYNWSSLQNHYYSNDFGVTGASEVARLMKDVGTSVNMNYDCSGSGALMSKVHDAFVQNFGYSSGGTLDNFIDRLETIKTNLINNQPVIFSGCREIHFGGLWYSGCHA